MQRSFAFFLTIFFVFEAVPALARDCRLPLRTEAEARDLVNCLLAEIHDLKREQVQLRRLIEEQARALQELPGDYRNDNGIVSRDRNRRLSTATVLFSSSEANSISGIKVAQDVLEELCAREGGCALSLTLRAEGHQASPPRDETITGPCLLNYTSQTGAWLSSGDCGAVEAKRGQDGDGVPTGDGGAEVIAEAGGGCLLADSNPNIRIGPGNNTLGRDHEMSLFVIAASDLRQNGSGRFRCELKIE